MAALENEPMIDQSLSRTVWVAKPPVHSALWHSAVAGFVGALLTDVTYWRTTEMMWANFSAWLLAAGLVVGVLSAITCLFDLLSCRLVGVHRLTWPYVLGNATVLILAFFNALVHSRDAWTSVVPTGLALSAVTVAVAIVAGWLGRSFSYRYRVQAGVVE